MYLSTKIKFHSKSWIVSHSSGRDKTIVCLSFIYDSGVLYEIVIRLLLGKSITVFVTNDLLVTFVCSGTTEIMESFVDDSELSEEVSLSILR